MTNDDSIRVQVSNLTVSITRATYIQSRFQTTKSISIAADLRTEGIFHVSMRTISNSRDTSSTILNVMSSILQTLSFLCSEKISVCNLSGATRDLNVASACPLLSLSNGIIIFVM